MDAKGDKNPLHCFPLVGCITELFKYKKTEEQRGEERAERERSSARMCIRESRGVINEDDLSEKKYCLFKNKMKKYPQCFL